MRELIVCVLVWMTWNVDVWAQAACVDGMADVYPCENIDLLAHVPLDEMDAVYGTDLWGWVDPETEQEIVLYTHSRGTTFVDVSDPVNPAVRAILPAVDNREDGIRDAKTIGNYAVIVSEAGLDGLQIVDLTQLRTITSTTPVTLTLSAHFTGFVNAHNLHINEETGFAYAAGARGTCARGGVYIIDLNEPTNPQDAGCYDVIDYVHDIQCVLYDGVDEAYVGRELCFASSNDTVDILDVSDKTDIQHLSSTTYLGNEYAHQGWLTADHRFFVMGDEFDEMRNGHNGRTYVWDIADLTQPTIHMTFDQDTAAIDHNIYIHNGFAYMANYNAGVYVVDLRWVELGVVERIGRFDLYLPDDSPIPWHGAWTAYPYFPSGIVVASSIDDGLFVLQPTFSMAETAAPLSTKVHAVKIIPSSQKVTLITILTLISLLLVQRRNLDHQRPVKSNPSGHLHGD